MGSYNVMESYGVVWVVMNLYPTYMHMYSLLKINDDEEKLKFNPLLQVLPYSSPYPLPSC